MTSTASMCGTHTPMSMAIITMSTTTFTGPRMGPARRSDGDHHEDPHWGEHEHHDIIHEDLHYPEDHHDAHDGAQPRTNSPLTYTFVGVAFWTRRIQGVLHAWTVGSPSWQECYRCKALNLHTVPQGWSWHCHRSCQLSCCTTPLLPQHMGLGCSGIPHFGATSHSSSLSRLFHALNAESYWCNRAQVRIMTSMRLWRSWRRSMRRWQGPRQNRTCRSATMRWTSSSCSSHRWLNPNLPALT